MERIFGKKKVSFSISELHSVRQDYLTVATENPDGVRVVEQVALQHGTIIPGFGKTSEFYTVELEFKDSKRFIIFSSEEPAVANEIVVRFKNFIKIHKGNKVPLIPKRGEDA